MVGCQTCPAEERSLSRGGCRLDARVAMFAGADWLILQMYKLFSYGDRRGTVEAFSVLPKHRIDQRLSDYIKTLSLES